MQIVRIGSPDMIRGDDRHFADKLQSDYEMTMDRVLDEFRKPGIHEI